VQLVGLVGAARQLVVRTAQMAETGMVALVELDQLPQ
jgi:hypothetical protein